MRRALSQLGLLIALPAAALAAERFPPPEFTSGHRLPETTTPPPRAETLSQIDIAVLALALSVACYLIFKKRSRRSIVVLALFSLGYFGFYRKGCVCPIGAMQNVVLSLSDSSYALPVSAAVFFLLPIAFALFAGRAFCSGVCPIGAAQEVALLRPVKVPTWLAHVLGLLPWFYLGLAVLYAATGTAFIICRYDPFVSFFRLGGGAAMMTISVSMLLVSMFVGRPYCRFLCPYGAVLRVVAPFAKWQVAVSLDDCVECRQCEPACPFGAITRPAAADASVPAPEVKRQLAALVAILPLLVLAAGWLGYRSSGALSRLERTVLVAERVWMEGNHKVAGTTDQSRAFYALGMPSAELYRKALDAGGRFRTGGTLFGAWVGLVIGLKLIALNTRRQVDRYTADPAACVACGRCYRSCPVERARHRKRGTRESSGEAEK